MIERNVEAEAALEMLKREMLPEELWAVPQRIVCNNSLTEALYKEDAMLQQFMRTEIGMVTVTLEAYPEESVYQVLVEQPGEDTDISIHHNYFAAIGDYAKTVEAEALESMQAYLAV